MHLIVPLLLTLAPGRYLAETPAGERVELVLHADGRALFGGAACAWEQSAGALRLGAHVLKEDGGCHVGPPFGRLCFSPAPLTVPRDPAPPPAPAPLVGEWVFSGSGGGAGPGPRSRRCLRDAPARAGDPRSLAWG